MKHFPSLAVPTYSLIIRGNRILVPSIRIVDMNHRPVRQEGRYVLYWMSAFRRPTWNFALQRAIEWAEQLGKPLVILEALRVGYPWASDRLHTFILEGMADHLAWFQDKSVTYYPYVERKAGEGSGLLESLARQSAVIVTDDFPCFFLPRMIESAATKVDILMEKVDSNGLLPMRAADRVFARAFDFRRFLQKSLAPHLEHFPTPDPLFHCQLAKPVAIPADIRQRWPAATKQHLSKISTLVDSLPIDHSIGAGWTKGGFASAVDRLKQFVAKRLARYGEDRNEPALDGTSGLSPYLHFGQLSVHQILAELADAEEWSPASIGTSRSGQREGWWRMSPMTESFLDELVTWREVGFNFCWQRPDYDQFESLPDWAKETLAKHARDKRQTIYSLEQFESASTHDPLWNAAQNQIRREGRMHNYLRMLWERKYWNGPKRPKTPSPP